MAATSSEPQREREVQRYLQSWQVAQGSALAVAQNVGSIGAPNEHGADFKPKASGDKALTAFAQLAVLRLNVKRAMVSIIDSSSQTILTEATNNFRFAVQGPAGAGSNADDLWLGTSILSRPDAVCEHCLINTYTARDPDGRTHTAPGLVIPDCRLDPRFDTRPYVVSEPGVRFYAGVPIISRNGHKIGAYAVSDEQPREGLTVDELQFMQGVAQAVMEHLEWARDRVDRFKGERIVRGLASFIEGSSARDDDSAAARDDLSPRPPEMSLTAAKHGGHGASSRRGACPARASSPAQPQPEPSSASSMPAKDMPAKGTPAKGDRQRPDGMARMFHRAAEILRTSTLADGVALFGATATSAKQSSRPRRPNSSDDDEVSLNVTSGSEGVGLDSSDSDTSPAARPCKILAYSLADEKARADIEQGPALSLGTLEKYYSLFPKGKALSFTGEGVGVSSEDDSASDREPSRAGARRKVRMDHEELLKKIPGVKAVVFVPLYDYAEDRLAGGCFLWTSVTGRLMNLDEDLSYLRAFGNSIMSEVARINTQKNEAAKTTFIASMSHELRSPLHGILGAAEFFRDTPLTSYQSGLIASITTCGKTLLDTLNHVLDYSKINRLGRMQLRRSAKQNKLLKLSTDSLDSLNITAAVDLAVLVEEVVDATSAGHTFKGASEAPVLEERYLPTSSVDQSVSVLLDISCRPSWMVRTQPGAIRRIIMNLFGNALKYTTKGSVHVSLRGQQERDGSKIDVLLKVVDTGKGMSEEFQRNRLFVPFSQEDSFQPGTGLGLSIVKQIVDSLGGTIEVDSQQGKGTEITVRLHLSPVANEPSAGGDDILQSVVQRTRGRLLVLLDGDSESPAAEHQDRRLEHVLKETCATWFDLKVARDGDEDASDPDLFLYSEPPSVSALERRFRPSGDMTPRDKEVPIVLVCLNAKDAVQISQKQTRVLTSLSKIVEVIPQPCGPRKLAKVFNQVFQMVDETARARGTVGGGALAYPRPQISRSEKPLSAEEADRSGLAETLEVGPSATSGRPSAMLGLASPPPLDPGTPAFDAGPSSPPAAEEVPQSTARHVLLVDDNKINLQLLVMFMKKCGFSYAEAENGQEALDRYTDACIPASQSTGPGRRRFDFVLMDISMPVMDGLESTRRIREFERENEIAPANIIALTGLASADAQRDTQLAGIDVFIPKPVRFAKLRKLLSPV